MGSDPLMVTCLQIDEGITGIDGYVFNIYSNLEEITLPDALETIGESAFDNLTYLESLAIPDGVTSIGDYAFDGCTSLKTLTLSALTAISSFMSFKTTV